MWASGRSKGTPFQPSMIAWLEVPSPSTKRSPRQLREGAGRHRQHRRRAVVDRHDRRPDRGALGRASARAPARREGVGSVGLGQPDRGVAPLGLGAAAELHALARGHEGRGQADGEAAEVHGATCGGIRTAPSRRIVSPFSMAFSTIWSASDANSGGRPRREGNGIVAARAWRAGSGIVISSGVSKSPGAIVQTRIPSFARSRAIGKRHADDARLRGRVGGLADLPVEGRGRRGVHDDAALAVRVRRVLRHLGGREAQHVEAADQVDLDRLLEDAQVEGPAVLVDGAHRRADARAVHADVEPAEARRGFGDGRARRRPRRSRPPRRRRRRRRGRPRPRRPSSARGRGSRPARRAPRARGPWPRRGPRPLRSRPRRFPGSPWLLPPANARAYHSAAREHFPRAARRRARARRRRRRVPSRRTIATRAAHRVERDDLPGARRARRARGPARRGRRGPRRAPRARRCARRPARGAAPPGAPSASTASEARARALDEAAGARRTAAPRRSRRRRRRRARGRCADARRSWRRPRARGPRGRRARRARTRRGARRRGAAPCRRGAARPPRRRCACEAHDARAGAEGGGARARRGRRGRAPGRGAARPRRAASRTSRAAARAPRRRRARFEARRRVAAEAALERGVVGGDPRVGSRDQPAVDEGRQRHRRRVSSAGRAARRSAGAARRRSGAGGRSSGGRCASRATGRSSPAGARGRRSR